eukprot:TRINITY_DN1894_c0_g1_i3.p1 TRINITY_DN1894_c0_g1~~TRINITY_DN1894_c0_g1_i3.p1  ORF type:complete len:199 (-),score=19.11 TRINITY_DN1894_c0_g1_i3:251-847(-)
MVLHKCTQTSVFFLDSTLPQPHFFLLKNFTFVLHMGWTLLTNSIWIRTALHRVSTACLLVILSQFYRPTMVFLSLLALDIASHWLQMYSTFLAGKASHKDVKDSTNWLLKAYYGNRLFMCYCCVASEVLYIILFLLAGNEPESVINVLVNAVKQGSLLSLPAVLSLFGWAIKQVINVIQMKTAADVCVLYDMNRKEKP